MTKLVHSFFAAAITMELSVATDRIASSRSIVWILGALLKVVAGGFGGGGAGHPLSRAAIRAQTQARIRCITTQVFTPLARKPPSTASAVPVTKLAASDARKTAAPP